MCHLYRISTDILTGDTTEPIICRWRQRFFVFTPPNAVERDLIFVRSTMTNVTNSKSISKNY